MGKVTLPDDSLELTDNWPIARFAMAVNCSRVSSNCMTNKQNQTKGASKLQMSQKEISDVFY